MVVQKTFLLAGWGEEEGPGGLMTALAVPLTDCSGKDKRESGMERIQLELKKRCCYHNTQWC